MRKVVFLALGLALAGCGGKPAGKPQRVIGVVSFVSHPAVDATEKGFEDALARSGVTDVTFDRQNAHGDTATAFQIAQKLANDRLDLVHTMTTPASQAVVMAVKTTPVVYSAVTDPVDAGLVPTMGAAGGNVTGVSDAWPIEQQIRLYHEMVPAAKRWGTVYNPGDANSVVSVRWTREVMAKLGLKLVESTLSSSSEVMAAAQSLLGRVDAIYVTSDNTVISAFAAVAGVANANRLPLFAGDTESVAEGAIAALGFDYYQVGYAAGLKAAMILKGEKTAGEIPSGFAENPSLHLNLGAAAKQGVVIEPRFVAMARKAGKVIESTDGPV
jgi:putative tryptophan/tyrosine transport system substrate-binding protein